MANTLFVILLIILVLTIIAMIYVYLKSKEDDIIVDEKLVRSIRAKDDPQYTICPTYDALDQLDENQKNIAYVHAPKYKRGMYRWVPDENEWVRISK